MEMRDNIMLLFHTYNKLELFQQNRNQLIIP